MRSEIWYLTSPPTGSNSVAISSTAVQNTSVYAASAASFSGVDQTTPLGALVTATGTGTTPSVTAASAAGEAVLDVVGTVGSTTPAADASQQSLQTAHNGTSVSLGMSEKPGGASVAMSWTVPSAAWVEAAVPVRASSAQTGTGVFDFVALRDAGAVRLSWRLGLDPRSVGFYVHRQDGIGGPRQRISAEMIGSGPVLVGERRFAWTDEGALPGELLYWLEDVMMDGRSTWTGPLRLPVEGSGVGSARLPGVDGPSTTRASPADSGEAGFSCALRRHRPLVLGAAELPLVIALVIALRRRSRRYALLSLGAAALVAIVTTVASPALATGGVAIDGTTASGTANFSHTVGTNPNSLLLVTVVTPAACVGDVTSWNLATPGAASNGGGNSASNAPTITGSVATNGNVVKLYTDASCSTQYGSNATVASNAFSITGTVPGTDGVKSFWYTIADASGNTKACTTTGLSYTYQAKPIYTLSRTFYSYQELTGAKLGTNDLLTVTRDEAGIADTVTLTPYAVSALAGTNFTNAPVTVTFASTATSSYPAAANPLGIIHDSVATSDLFFTIKLTTTASGTTNAASITQGQVNILDFEYDGGNYFFGTPLVTVTDTAGSVALTVQRRTTGTAEAVTVDFMDGTAIGGSDYTSTQRTATFGTTDTEIAVSVPIANVASNRSFYARINVTSSVPSSGADVVRRQSLCKVRILDAAEDTSSAVCDVTLTNAFGGGTGGDAAHPYTICNAAQFDRIRSYLTGTYFKLIADIDASGDASNAYAAITPIDTAAAPAAFTTYFSGFLDGNERTVSNFSYVGNGTVASTGLFRRLGTTTSNTAYVKNLNVNFASVTNVSHYAGLVAGSNGYATGRAALNVDSVFASGYVQSAGDYVGLAFGEENMQYAAVQVLSLTSVMTAGTVASASASYAGGTFGYMATGASGSFSLTMNGLYAGVAIVAPTSTYVGAIAGYMDLGLGAATAVSASIQNVHTRGWIDGGSDTGGFIGKLLLPVEVPLQASTNLTNAAWVQATGNYVGGLYGTVTAHVSAQQNGVLGGANVGGVYATAGYAGGLIGYYSPSNATSGVMLTLQNGTNSGAVATVASHAGGILGAGVQLAGDWLVLDGNTNSGAVYSGGAMAGGIAGNVSTGASGTYLVFTSNTNSGPVEAATSSAGGVLGDFGVLDSSDSLEVEGCTNSGAVTGTGYIGGLLGYVDIGAVTIGYSAANSNSGTITGTSNGVGGAIGYLHGTDAYVGNTTNTGSVTSSGGSVGGVIGYALPPDGGTWIASGLYSHTGGVTTTTTSGSAGGIVGLLAANLSSTATSVAISGCKSTSTVSSANVNTTNSGTGGLIGLMKLAAGTNQHSNTTFTIDKSWAAGTVDGGTTGTQVGGLIGNIYCVPSAGYVASGPVTITKSFAGGAVTGKAPIGGLIGNVTTTETRCMGAVTASNVYSTGTVTGTGGTYVGGLIGYGNAAATTAPLTLDKLYGASCVSGTSTWKGAVFGRATSTATYTNGFWRQDAGVCNSGLTQAATGINTAAATDGHNKTQTLLQTAATFPDATFTPAIWTKVDGSYPTLVGMP